MTLTAEEIKSLRQGFYTDEYFNNIVRILSCLHEENYSFAGESEIPGASEVLTGDLEVEMQFFSRRKPWGLVVGLEDALAILRQCTGYYEGEDFVNTFDQLEVQIAEEGSLVAYSGNPLDIKPVLKIRGRYKDFARLETPILGVLSEGTKVATNVFEILKAADGKEILFFPARFAHYLVQPIHGQAYRKAVEVFNKRYQQHHRVCVSTAAQGSFWQGQGCGTTAHAYVAVFLGDTAEMMLQFCRILPPEVPRVALVDFHNDCVSETKKVAEALFRKYWELLQAGNNEEAERYRLFAVRADTSGNMVDSSIEPLGLSQLDCGVNARLVANIRKALDEAFLAWKWLPEADLPLAKEWCQAVKIVVTGGFNQAKIAEFEKLGVPVDIYGVGSSLLHNCSSCGSNADFTADIVRAKINGQWHVVSKAGRKPAVNTDLKDVQGE